MSRSRPLLPKVQVAVAIVVGWGGCVWAFGWGNGTAIAFIALFTLLTARQWVEERIAARIAAREPRVWFFYFRLTPVYVERTVTAGGAPWQAEKFGDGFSPEFKIEEYPHKLRVHQWQGGRYFWTDYTRPWSRDTEHGEFWKQEIGDFRTNRCIWRLGPQTLEGARRAVSLVLSLRRDERGSQQETTNVVFSVPLDEELLEQGRGTGQEHAERECAGQSAAENWDWHWSVHRES